MENMLNKMDQIERLRKAGFRIDVYEDRDFADFNNIRVLDYRKDITPECSIIFSEYQVAERPGEFELKEQSAELLIGEDSVALLPDLSKLIDLLEKLLEIVIHKNTQLFGTWAVHPNGKMVNSNGGVIPPEELAFRDWLLYYSTGKKTNLNDFVPAFLQACRNAGIIEIKQATTYQLKYLKK